ncbi:MAG: hypothetical protein JJ900_16205 [Rhodospirillales bacterium]|nr:hypothetical protein [Rhodospirillales bacterium]MBO6788392.1 hypothetical protein [Rhodospirillales bacterium]
MSDCVHVNGMKVTRALFEQRRARARVTTWRHADIGSRSNACHCMVCEVVIAATVLRSHAYRSDDQWLCPDCHRMFLTRTHRRQPEQGAPCSCCGYLTLSGPGHDTYEICPVCGWEDDPVQHEDPHYAGGANDESLRDAQRNFRETGAANRSAVNQVRPPEPGEMPEDVSG